MQFDWDPAKNRANVAKHGVSFERACRIFEGPVLTVVDDRDDLDEMREVSLGAVDAVVIFFVVHTDRDGVTRLISARRATNRERRRYEAAIR